MRMESDQRFGKLVVLTPLCQSRSIDRVDCLCDCGNRASVILGNLKSGNTRSCGCLHKQAPVTHGFTSDGKAPPIYGVWTAMLSRCLNKNHKQYRHYGGRGITVCDRWRESFVNFYADMGDPPQGHSIDRINNDGNYEPGNCRWATPKMQAQNRRPRK